MWWYWFATTPYLIFTAAVVIALVPFAAASSAIETFLPTRRPRMSRMEVIRLLEAIAAGEEVGELDLDDFLSAKVGDRSLDDAREAVASLVHRRWRGQITEDQLHCDLQELAQEQRAPFG